MSTVSVIIPNYNHARFLSRRIESVLRQTFQDFELILLDDCSTDESRSILSRYADDPRVRMEFNEKNSGSTFKQWNKGVRLARGKYVWIAESDDYADERLLEHLVAVLEADPDVSFAYCRSRCVDEHGRVGIFADIRMNYDSQRWVMDFYDGGYDACRKYFLLVNPIVNASAVVFRKRVFDKVGGADETLRYCGDWKLWAAMVLEGKLAYRCKPLNYYRFHGGTVRSNSSKEALQITEPLQVFRWFAQKGLLTQGEVEKIREAQAGAWLPALMSMRTSLAVKRELLRHARAFDPDAFRRVLREALMSVGLKIRRYWRGLLDRKNMPTAGKRGVRSLY